MTVHMPTDEDGRLAALHRYRLVGLGPSEALERIAITAHLATGAPRIAISLIGRDAETMLAAWGDAARHIPRGQSLGAIAICDDGPMVIEDTLSDPRTAGLFSGDEAEDGIRGYLAVPLRTADHHSVGVLALMDTVPRRFTHEQVTLAVNLAEIAMAQLETHQPDRFDYLTGALTRHRFQSEVEREFARSRRYERPASLIFLDIDRFSAVNAALGMDTADEILQSVANLAIESLRATDSFGRIGGTQFGILLPETLAYEASQCAERLRDEIARLRFRNERGVLSVTGSFGVAPFDRTLASAIQWFAQADVALYASKQAGRNCVSFAPPMRESGLLGRGEAPDTRENDPVH